MDVIFDWNLGNMIYNGLITLRLYGFPFAEIRSFQGPLVIVVSHPLVPPLEVDHHRTAVHVVYLHLTRVCEQCSH